MKENLSERELQAFRYIKIHISLLGVAPTRLEIAEGIGLNSKQHASVLVKNLRRKGWIDLDDYEPRSIRVVEVKDEVLGDGLHEISTRANGI